MVFGQPRLDGLEAYPMAQLDAQVLRAVVSLLQIDLSPPTAQKP